MDHHYHHHHVHDLFFVLTLPVSTTLYVWYNLYWTGVLIGVLWSIAHILTYEGRSDCILVQTIAVNISERKSGTERTKKRKKRELVCFPTARGRNGVNRLYIRTITRCHGLSVYPVCVCNTVRLGQDTTWNRREHRLSVSPNWVCTMLGGYKRWTFSDGFGDKPSHSIRCVYRADLILCR